MLNKNNKLRHSISLAAVLALSGLSATAWACLLYTSDAADE